MNAGDFIQRVHVSVYQAVLLKASAVMSAIAVCPSVAFVQAAEIINSPIDEIVVILAHSNLCKLNGLYRTNVC